MRRALPILWILIAASARAQDSANAAAPESDVLVVSAARLITGTGADLMDARVVISDGKITAVGPAAETTAPEYRHQWRHGDILIWDNAQVQHRAYNNFPMGEPRRMIRFMVGQEKPMG